MPQKNSAHWFWALDSITCNIQQGEVVGLIGANGAGKSTLLKLLARITEPTTGSLSVNGRLGALLEVGTGFHRDLSGRENIFLNGSILGMKRHEIQNVLHDVIEFSNVGNFIDQPVKYYSSGMYARLAFSVAAHLQCEVMLIDEVLAVGDIVFQSRCLQKIRDLAQSGRTILLVSHYMNTLLNLTQRCLWLQHGQLVKDGPTAAVVADYLGTSLIQKSATLWQRQKYVNEMPERLVQLESIVIQTSSANEPFRQQDALGIKIVFQVKESLIPRIGFALVHQTNQVVCNCFTSQYPEYNKFLTPGYYEWTIRLLPGFLNVGRYRLDVSLQNETTRLEYMTVPEAVTFDISENISASKESYAGVVRPLFHNEMKPVSLSGSPVV